MSAGRPVPLRVLVELRHDQHGRLSAHVRGIDPVVECGDVGLSDLPLLLEALWQDADLPG